MKDLWLKVLPMLRNKEAFAQLFVRASVGVMFMGGALKNKLSNLDKFTEFFRELGIPAAAVQAPMVAILELVCGVLLIIGLGTRFAAAALAGTMVVAMGTAATSAKHGTLKYSVERAFDASFVDGVLNFIYMPEFLLFAILVWFVFAGPGRFSVDHGIARQHNLDK